MFCEQLNCKLLFRLFADMERDKGCCDRLLERQVAGEFFRRVNEMSLDGVERIYLDDRLA